MRVKRKNGLTDKQESYAKLRAAGKGCKESYLEAGYSKNEKDVINRVGAHRLEHTEKVKARIEQLQAQADAGAIMNIKQITAALADIASDDNKPDGVRLKAFDQLTRIMGGYNDASNINVTASLSLDDTRAAIDSLFEE